MSEAKTRPQDELPAVQAEPSGTIATLLENDLPVAYVMEVVKGPLMIQKTEPPRGS